MSFESAASATLLPFASQSGAAVGRRLPAGGAAERRNEDD